MSDAVIAADWLCHLHPDFERYFDDELAPTARSGTTYAPTNPPPFALVIRHLSMDDQGVTVHSEVAVADTLTEVAQLIDSAIDVDEIPEEFIRVDVYDVQRRRRLNWRYRRDYTFAPDSEEL